MPTDNPDAVSGMEDALHMGAQHAIILALVLRQPISLPSARAFRADRRAATRRLENRPPRASRTCLSAGSDGPSAGPRRSRSRRFVTRERAQLHCVVGAECSMP